jgi:hypothetical protein
MTPKWIISKAALTSLPRKLGISAMKLLSLFMQHKFYSTIVILLSLILAGLVSVYQHQVENQMLLQQVLGGGKPQPAASQDTTELISLLKSIQVTQAEQNKLLAKLATTQPEPNKVPASKMKKFKHGAYRPAKATGY